MAEVAELRRKNFLVWLTAVDDDPYGEDLLQGVQTKLEAAQFQTPKSLRGANEDEVASLWDGNVGIKAFLRRCIKAAN